MRYTRLRRQIESGTLIGTHGTPFTGSADKIFEASTKRKRAGGVNKSSEDARQDEELVERKSRGRDSKRSGVDDGKENGTETGRKMARGKGGGKDKEVQVKEEQESDFSSTSSDFEDSEDEIPLAKLRKARLGPFQSPSSSKPYVSPYVSRPIGPSQAGNAVPISIARFGLGTTEGFGGGQDATFGDLGSAFHSSVGIGLNGRFVNGNGKSGVEGWIDVDWARWQSRFAGGEGMKGSL